MGGACDTQIKGDTAREMMDNGAKHLQQSDNEGDKKARGMMEEMQSDPGEQKKWAEDFEKKFAQLPED
jgi:polyhydroxyalkanoate synthesis regulator phasin